MAHLPIERMLSVLLLVDVVLELLLALALVFDVVSNVKRVQAGLFHVLDVLDVLIMQKLITSLVLVVGSLDFFSFEGEARFAIVVLVFVSGFAPISSVGMLFMDHLIGRSPDFISLFGLQLHFVNFGELGIKHLLCADVLIVVIDIFLVLELSVKTV